MEARYDHIKQEQAAQERWQHEQLYSFTFDGSKPIFSIDTPPPTVSGSLHIGHIFSYTHQDIIARYKRMKGHAVFYPMGYDDNGLPTERFVEKKHGIKGHKMARSEFVKLCLTETHEVEKMFEALWKKMGFSVDWNLTYSTISAHAQRVAQESFLVLYKDNKVYRKSEPSLYCATCRTSVAQAELESVELPSTFYTIQFADQQGAPLLVATTRPELLPACVAVLYHPADERYQHLKGQSVRTPYFNQAVPALADESVSIDKGTGLVMCCTFGDQMDIQWAETHKLPIKQIINRDGTWHESTGPLAGLLVVQARKKIVELLTEHQLVLDQKSLVHAVNAHERCKQPIEYLSLHQWFVKILEYKKEFLALGNQINWYPENMKSRYIDWVENLSWDWGISRQRFYGIPFPVWHCSSCAHVIVPEVERLPIDPQETAFGAPCPKCQSVDLQPDTDVMDTWNTSSLTPQILQNWPHTSPITPPMSMRPQAHDIIRTWAFDTIVKSWFHHQTIPWKDIVISGHVRAGKEKISKSKENSTISPEFLLANFSADAIRFWTAHGRLGTDTAFSEQQLKIGQRLVTKLWNAFLYLKPHIVAPQKRSEKLKANDLLNQWLLQKADQLLTEFIADFEEYEYTSALERVERFFWHYFCDQYLEIIKDQFNNPDKYDAVLPEETGRVLYEVGLLLLQLYAPFVPHIVDELYQVCFKESEQLSSIHAFVFDQNRIDGAVDEAVLAASEDLLVLISQVRRLKSEAHVSLKTTLQNVTVYGPVARTQLLQNSLVQHFKGVSRAENVLFEDRYLGANEMKFEQKSEELFDAIIGFVSAEKVEQ